MRMTAMDRTPINSTMAMDIRALLLMGTSGVADAGVEPAHSIRSVPQTFLAAKGSLVCFDIVLRVCNWDVGEECNLGLLPLAVGKHRIKGFTSRTTHPR